MKWAVVILLVLSPAILYGIAIAVIALSRKYFPLRCPSCSKRGLAMVNSSLVMLDDGDGKHHCEYRSFYKCPSCHASFRRTRSGISPLPEEEQHWLNAKP
ncbi:MAG: hypothetical protein ABFD92_01165 [Planctomycetaceae bacterium]|nr:hypothetical protein [Planctomycetaceae bacterium]